jgi:hypothetical protein
VNIVIDDRHPEQNRYGTLYGIYVFSVAHIYYGRDKEQIRHSECLQAAPVKGDMRYRLP